MEQVVTDFTIFEDFRNRQVIFNYYQNEDFLWKRDGFNFNTVHVENGRLLFTKQNELVASIALDDVESVSKNSQFPNYFIFRKGLERLEVYFP